MSKLQNNNLDIYFIKFTYYVTLLIVLDTIIKLIDVMIIVYINYVWAMSIQLCYKIAIPLFINDIRKYKRYIHHYIVHIMS